MDQIKRIGKRRNERISEWNNGAVLMHLRRAERIRWFIGNGSRMRRLLGKILILDNLPA